MKWQKHYTYFTLAIIILLAIGFFAKMGNYTSTYNEEFVLDSFTSSTKDAAPTSVQFYDDDSIAQETSFIDESIPVDPEQGQYIVKNGTISMTVVSTEATATALQNIAAAYGGTVLSRSINSDYRDTSLLEGTVVLTVAQDQFETAIKEIKAMAISVASEYVSSDNVTDQVIDLEARLNNAQAEEQSYLTVLNQAQSVEDILKVQNYLSNVREEIERYEAQLQNLTSKTTYSTITVILSEETSVTFESNEFRPKQAIVEAVQTVIESAQNLIIGLIYIIIVGGAVIIPLGIIYGIYKLAKKSKKKKK